jgi:hypothetical protein
MGIQQDLDELERQIAEFEKVLGKRSRPATNNPYDLLAPSAYPHNDDDGDGNEHPYDAQMNELTDGEDDPDVDPDQDELDSGELDDTDDDNDPEPPLSLRNNRQRMGKAYAQVDSATTGTNTPPPVTHKFESKINYIKARDGCSASEAASRARRENPILYEIYLKSGLAKSLAPYSNNYWAAVQDQMRKYALTETVARQRVEQMFGANIPKPDLAKGDTPVTRFHSVGTKIMQKRGIERTEALRLARKRNPRLFAKFQEV